MELDREDDLERPLLRTVDDANVASHPSSKSPGDDVAARSPTQGGDGAGALSRLTFGWVSPLLQLGARTEQLHQSDLPDVPHNLLPAACAEELWLAWGREAARAAAAGRPPSLLRAVASAFGWQYLRLGGLKLVNDVLNFAGPIFLNGLLRYLSSGAAAAAAPGLHHQQPAFLALAGRHLDVGSPTFGTWCAGLLAASLLLKGLLNAHYNYSQGLVSNRLRAAVTCAVFRRTLELNAAALAGVGTGRVQTLMSVDADRLVGLCAGAHELWSLPLQIAAALWLLHTQVDFAFLAGLAIVLAIIPLNRLLAGAIQAASVRMMAAKDERVQVMGEALRGVRQIKAAAWEAAFAARAGAARERELGALAVRKYLDALCVYLWAATSLLFSLGTFGLYAFMGRPLTPEVVFTSLALFNVLLTPINAFPWVLNGVVEAGVSVRRLGEFMRRPGGRQAPAAAAADQQQRGPRGDTSSEKQRLLAHPVDTEDGAAVRIRGGTFAWGAAGEGQGGAGAPVLCDVDLCVAAGQFVAVTGDVGSGKSSLLCAVLGELERHAGSVALAGGAAYVAQDPWAMQGSVRDNILLGAPLRPERYQAALHACALLPDLAAMPAGDATAVGDRGATLSGGQRARLALARALYREDAGVVLLDDVLASVDASVAAWLVEHALRGPLLQGKTVLAVTHLPVVLEAADAVVTLDGGRVASVVERPGGGWRPPGRAPGAGGRREAADDPREYSVLPPPSAAEDDVEMGRPAAAQAAQEERETGHVRWAVYRQYMRFQGAWVPITLASLALMQASRNASDLWLSYWVAHTTAPPPHSDGLPAAPLGRATAALDPDVKFYLGVLLLLAAVNSAFTLARAFAFAQGGLVAARRLHRRLLLATLALPASFFDATPSGRVLNRFSSDTATADDSLPFIANIFLAHAFCLAGVAAVLLYTQPLLAAALLPAALAYRRLQRYYRATSRELRRLDAVARSPVYSAFASALDGGPTIRAFGAEPYFMAAAEAAVGAQQRAGLAALAASCWLGLRLQAMAAGVAAGVAALAVAQRCGVVPAGGGAAGAGLVGLSLAYVLPITGLLNGLLVTGAETEQEMVAVERIGQYLALSPQPDVLPRSPLAPAAATPRGAAAALRDGPSPGALLQVRGRSVSPPRASPAPRPQQAAGADWPSAGRVTFANVWLRYGLGPFVLQHLDLDVPAGTKLGLCGRTGAGKSSAVACLLRLEETCAGAVCIDGVDVRSVPLRRLRRAVAYVPQAPFIFSATLAENMDPLRRSTDADLAAALRHVALWEPLCALSGGAAGETPPASGVLRMRLGEGGVSLSQGQQQLLSLARVLLRRPKVVCLDECTSSVDPGTAAAMHAVTRTFLSDATVIEVAHRLSSIEDCDVVAVMEAGRVIEAGRPRDLLRERSSAFAGMIRQQRHGHGGAEARAGCRTS